MSYSRGSAARARPHISRRSVLKCGVALAAGGPAIFRIRAAESEVATIIGDAPQLFVDLNRVTKLDRIKQTFHAAQKDPRNPVLRKEKPWETLYGTWGTVIIDAEEKIFKA